MFRVNPDMSKFSGFSVMKNYGYVLALALYGKSPQRSTIYAMLTSQFASVYS